MRLASLIETVVVGWPIFGGHEYEYVLNPPWVLEKVRQVLVDGILRMTKVATFLVLNMMPSGLLPNFVCVMSVRVLLGRCVWCGCHLNVAS